jgi:aspartyl aminopeptidase
MASFRAKRFIDFVNEARSPFHAVDQAAKLLETAGFQKITEKASWELKKGGSYYFTRNQSSIVAFSVGVAYKPTGGFTVVGAHTDSPNLKVKPISRATSQSYLQVGVEPYGGGLWHTWFDRDLTVAGRVFLRVGESLQSRLVSIRRPLLRIPTLAIHLDREVNEALKFNKQDHLLPVLATAVADDLNQSLNHHPLLLQVLAEEMKCEVESIVNFDLSLCDNTEGTLGGARSEFIFSGRLDNLMMSFCSVSALLESLPTLNKEEGVRMVLLFDHEEIGSQSAYGADSSLVLDAMDRIVRSFQGLNSNIRHPGGYPDRTSIKLHHLSGHGPRNSPELLWKA